MQLVKEVVWRKPPTNMLTSIYVYDVNIKLNESGCKRWCVRISSICYIADRHKTSRKHITEQLIDRIPKKMPRGVSSVYYIECCGFKSYIEQHWVIHKLLIRVLVFLVAVSCMFLKSPAIQNVSIFLRRDLSSKTKGNLKNIVVWTSFFSCPIPVRYLFYITSCKSF